MPGEPMVRAVYRTVALPEPDGPEQQISAKIHYPALFGDTPEERNTGAIPLDRSRGAMPVAIIAPGVNLPFEAYAWLARRLAAEGIVAVCYQLIGEVMPGEYALNPAIDIAATRVGSDKRKPCGRAFQPLLDLLAKENNEGILAGGIDLSNVWFGGHSAGGTTALLSADRRWFPGLRGAFTYGAHTGLSTMLGYPEGHVEPIRDMPVLLLGGTRDGCIANSAHRYGEASGDPNGRVIETFDKASGHDAHHSALAIIAGANHFTFSHPFDPSTGRTFIDFEEECDPEYARDLIARLIIAFLAGDHEAMAELLGRPEIADGRTK